jgi:hypothetical protein
MPQPQRGSGVDEAIGCLVIITLIAVLAGLLLFALIMFGVHRG